MQYTHSYYGALAAKGNRALPNDVGLLEWPWRPFLVF